LIPTLKCFDQLLNEAVLETINDQSLPEMKAAIENCKNFAEKVQNSKSDQRRIQTAVERFNEQSNGDNSSELS
jgi:hypothetical protein